jgi:hypothetical protein
MRGITRYDKPESAGRIGQPAHAFRDPGPPRAGRPRTNWASAGEPGEHPSSWWGYPQGARWSLSGNRRYRSSGRCRPRKGRNDGWCANGRTLVMHLTTSFRRGPDGAGGNTGTGRTQGTSHDNVAGQGVTARGSVSKPRPERIPAPVCHAAYVSRVRSGHEAREQKRNKPRPTGPHWTNQTHRYRAQNAPARTQQHGSELWSPVRDEEAVGSNPVTPTSATGP